MSDIWPTVRRESKRSGYIIGITAARASKSQESRETQIVASSVTMSGIWKTAMRFWPIRSSTAKPIVKRFVSVTNVGEWNVP